MTSTPQLLPTNFLQEIMDSAEKQATSWLGDFVHQIWASSWKMILVFVAIVIITKLVTGRIGSLIYDFFYFGILALIIFIWGWGIFFNAYFDIIYALLYPVSYLLTGLILKKIRGERRM